MTEANATGAWYAQSSANPTVPSVLQVTADNHLAIPTALPPTTVPVALTDLVTITRAQYSRGSGLLTIDASTSDRLTPPVLKAYAGRSGALIGELAGAADALDRLGVAWDARVVRASMCAATSDRYWSASAAGTIGIWSPLSRSSKLDGSAKGGIVFAIETELGIPIKLVGLGETVADLAPFDPHEFVAALFDE